ncbi:MULTISPECIES: diaminopimelate epimerase [Paenibacillus]|uniref:diaminopimelate epimerase n=1 Tax=Paenibacillus TaxID=44249 RepID=UPI0022B92EB7|nr:diaminopimelate epimerase [Paenibacillus caseinilyticus]MCZ8521260.1 diaminopimelate epimerase [Paenibacillus caseinilyticus]
MNREISFIKCNPTQNMTILVKTDQPVEEYANIASKIMAYDSVYAEQVGFIRKPKKLEAAAYLQMAGGEFCGNACMALAAYLASKEGIQPNRLTEITLEASGTDHLVICQVKQSAEQFHCHLSMPFPNKIEQRIIMYEGMELDIAIVRYTDFIHIVMEVEAFTDTARERAQSLARLLGVTLGANLIGILLYNTNTNEMAPLIYVPPLDSMIWERGCGSGTASVGAYLAWKHGGPITAPIRQPGGTIQVTAQCDNEGMTSLAIDGVVGIVAEGKAYVEI